MLQGCRKPTHMKPNLGAQKLTFNDRMLMGLPRTVPSQKPYTTLPIHKRQGVDSVGSWMRRQSHRFFSVRIDGPRVGQH